MKKRLAKHVFWTTRRRWPRVKFSRVLFVALNVLLFSLLSWIWLLPYAHQLSGGCPIRFRQYGPTETVPIIYGLPTYESRLKAEAGEIVFGGCMPGSATSVCPHCFQPVTFRDWEAEYQPVE